MSGCWSEGELRASLDHELPARDLAQVTAHIGECARCGAIYEELSGRAARVAALLDVLAETAAVPVSQPLGRRNRLPHHWVGAAAGIAAVFTLAVVLTPHRISPPQPPAPPPFVEPAVRPVAAPPLVPRRVAGRRPVARRPPDFPQSPSPARVEDFVALDDQPIEAGVVVRVQLDGAADGARIPADVILGMDGRPRAIRFVNSFSGER